MHKQLSEGNVFRTDELRAVASTTAVSHGFVMTALCTALLGVSPPLFAQASSAVSSASQGEKAVHDYAIPAGPLAATLREIARITGRSIRFETRDVQGREAPAIQGRRHVSTAVQEAIAQSGLTMTTLANGDVAVFVPQMHAVTVTATRGEAETGFRASRSETSTRSDADLLDVPQAVTIVTAKVIETQQAQSVQEVLQNVAGVVTRENAQSLPTYTIRGFSQASTLSNGVTDPFSSATNIASIDRLEVLKGPQAILSGGDSLSGAVNIVTKKPTAERVRDVALQYGSFGDKRGSVDLAGAVTENKKLSFRLIGATARADRSVARYDGAENDYLSAQLRWKDDATDLNVGASYDDSLSRQGLYTFALNGAIQPIPKMRLGAKDAGVRLRSKAVFYSLEHAFSPSVTVVSRLQRTLTMQDLSLFQPRFPISTANMILSYGNTSDRQNYRSTSGDHYLRLSFATGPLAHTLSTGINHTSRRTNVYGYSGSGQSVPVYQDEQFPFVRLVRDASTLQSIYSTESEQRALFVQDVIRLGNWSATLGLRRTKYDSGPFQNIQPLSNRVTSEEKRSMSQTTPNAGLVYNLSATSSVYASYAEGFSPQFVTVRPCGGGTDFDPIETVNKEIGFKHGSEDGAFGFSAALFQLDQSNRLELNRADNCYAQRDGRRIRGLELESSGQLTAGWNLLFNYTYIQDKDLTDGTRLSGAQPRHQTSLWTTYDFQSEALRGFGVSAGLTAYSTARIGTLASDPMAPGGARVDAGISYVRDNWSLRLGVKNLFDRELYGYSNSTLYVPVQPGRTATLTFRMSL
ncbi:TonB-dependent siderophore receptor [Acidovorax sp. SDU_ACID1]|uniref:TonB-dependent siderophore receptor n=1 Tax=Acidovorax sp. SDU_ACID1 TaxID=3136632 RepID=UPI00387360E8